MTRVNGRRPRPIVEACSSCGFLVNEWEAHFYDEQVNLREALVDTLRRRREEGRPTEIVWERYAKAVGELRDLVRLRPSHACK